MLIEADAPYDGRTLAALDAGLLMGNVNTAVKAAELAGKLARPGLDDLAKLLERAFSHWQAHEKPYPDADGFVPESPRAKIVTALSKVRDPSFEELKAYVRDFRSDVVDAGLRVLIHRLATDEDLQKTFVQAIAQGQIAPHALGKTFAEDLTFAASSIEAAGHLLANPDSKVRYSAMGLLSNRYLNLEQIRSHAETLTKDPEQQIRELIVDLHLSAIDIGTPT